jgi:hypothetical protein
MEQVSVVFGDELPMSAFLPGDGGRAGRFVGVADITLPMRLLGQMNDTQQAAYAEVAILLDRLRAACGSSDTAGGASISGPALLEHLGGPHAVITALAAYRKIAAFLDEHGPQLHSPDESAAVPVRFYETFFDLLQREASAAIAGERYPHRILVERTGMRMLTRNYPHQHMSHAHVIWLDATGDPRLYREMFQRPVEVVDPYVPLKGATYQVTDSLNGKATLRNGTRTTDQADKVHEQVRTIIDQHGYHNPAIIASRDVLSQYQRHAQLHYYANRGTNRLQACDSVFVIGAPSPGHAAIYEQAAMLFQQRMRPLPPTAEAWSVVDRPYAYTAPDGTGRSITTAMFSDPDLHAVLWQTREAELIQSVHRVRPILHPVDVWILTNIPVDELPPTRLLTVADLFGVPTRTAYLDDGTPYEERAQVDPYVWRQVQLMADILCGDPRECGYLAPWHIVDGLHVSRAAANRYIRTLIDYCGYMEIPVTREGTRRPAVGCTRIFAGI